VLRGGARRAVALGFSGGRSAAVGHREGLQGPIKGEAGDLDVRALVKNHGRDPRRQTGSRNGFGVIPSSAAKLLERGRARVLASGFVLERGAKRGHGQRGSGGAE
jgi:hypothetical protein